MSSRKRILTLAAAIMAGVAATVAAVFVVVLYQTSFERTRKQLQEFSRYRASTIEAFFEQHAQYREHPFHPVDGLPNTCPICNEGEQLVLNLLAEATRRDDEYFGVHEFVVARREKTDIRFLLRHRYKAETKTGDTSSDTSRTVTPWDSELAEPMRLALSSKSGGTIVGKDYRGASVLAAYQPLTKMGWGIVVKLDIADIRAPFTTAIVMSTFVALTVIMLGILLLRRSVDPLIHRMETDSIALAASDSAKSEFLAHMSHEIRTPMTAILGFAENLLDADQSDSEKLNSVHTIRRNGEHLLDIINDILDLSKIEAGKMTIERGDCHPCRVVGEVASLMRARAGAKGLQLNIEYVGAIPETIQSNPARLRQILINLIGNAIKFTEVGTVRLVIRFMNGGDKPSLQFDVVDTGCGMTEEQKADLFQRFTQADASIAGKYGGTGLGLTISKRFAELLGGDICVAATEVGVGSTFRVTITTGPLEGVTMLADPMSTTAVVEAANTDTKITQTDLRGCRILLAEDGPDNQRLISFILEKAGASVTVADDGKLALEAVLAARDDGNPFDLILMDIQMPVMDGYEATGLLRQSGYTGPIIALTAYAMAGDREKCIRAGCDSFASKPINRVKLIQTIRRDLDAFRTGIRWRPSPSPEM